MNRHARGRARTLLATFRLPFLPLSVVCVFLGWASAFATGAPADLGILALVVLGALSAHISVNTFNEYFDFKSGIDLRTVRTPFSGGSGALPARPQAAGLVLGAAIVTSAITIVCGLLLVQRVGSGLIPLGLAGLLLVLTYTQWLNRNPFFSLVAAGTGFAIMTLGTHYALARTYDPTALVAAAAVFFFVNNLLLLNQFPDVEADREAGRRHLPAVFGRRRSAAVLGAFFFAAYVLLAGAVVLGPATPWMLLAFVPAPLAANVFLGARRYADDIARLLPYLARNVVVALLTPALIGLGLVLSVTFGR